MHSSYKFISDRIQSLFSQYSLPKIFEVLDYSTEGGKLTRYSMFTHICENSNSENSDDINKKLIGLCLELFHSSFILSDDIVDNSLVRRNKPCYYFKRKMPTLRDSKFLISLIYKLLSDSPCRSVFEKSFFDTCLGQTLDTKKKSREDYNLALYRKICELKTSSYSVYLPLACGYKLTKRDIPVYLEDLTNKVGLIYQMNDDYLNFFPKKLNKTGNDLEEYKLTYFTAKINEIFKDNMDVYKDNMDVYKEKALDVYFNQEGVPDFIKEWIFEYFPKYQEDKKALVDETRRMIKEEDERDLLFLYDVLKRYEQN